MKLLPASAIVGLLSTIAPVVSANYVPEHPLEKRVHDADVVAIGRAVSMRSERAGALTLEYARLHIDKTLKGNPPAEIEVITKGHIAEFNLQCCTTGSVYLLFLRKLKDGKYESVNGNFGVIAIPNQTK